MKNSARFFFILFLGFAFAHSAYASFEITEIMYDVNGSDTNREWIEVQNTGSSPDDLSKWHFYSDKTSHSLTPDTVSLVPAGEYAVIAQNVAKFKIDWPNFSGILFDSSWTGFDNSGATIALKDPSLAIVSSVTYSSSMGAAGDGNSLQQINASWVAAVPTPGVAYQPADTSTPSAPAPAVVATPPSPASSSGGGVGIPIKTKEASVPQISTDIVCKNLVVAGVAFPVDSVTLGYSKEPLIQGYLSWNFGDGMTKKQTTHEPFEYTYDYPGEYVMTLAYSQSYYTSKPNATDRVIVKVIPAGIAVSSIGTLSDPYVEIENTSAYEIPLSGWILKSGERVFTVPPDTVILPHKKLKFSGRVTGFAFADLQKVSLLYPSGQSISATPSTPLEPKVSVSSKQKVHTVHATSAEFPKVSAYSAVLDTTHSAEVNLNDLSGSAAGASALPDPQTISTVCLLALGAGGIFLIRHIHLLKKNGADDLEKGLRAEDITIIE
jgi:hypothetical protein